MIDALAIDFPQLLDCTLHPDRCVLRLLLYIPDVLCILYIRVVPPGIGEETPGMLAGPQSWMCAPFSAPADAGKEPAAPKTRPPGCLISKNRDRWLMVPPIPDDAIPHGRHLRRRARLMVRPIANFGTAFEPDWRSRSTSVPG
jgi:hypothetical protein